MQLLAACLLLGACTNDALDAEGIALDAEEAEEAEEPREAEEPQEAEESEELDDEIVSFHGNSIPENLTAAEWGAYRGGLGYVQGLVPARATGVALNHADPRQHEFSRLRLKLAGKTPQTAPQLFASLEQMREDHELAGYAIGTFASVEVSGPSAATSLTAAPNTMAAGARGTAHEFLSMDLLPNGNDAPVEQIATVVHSQVLDTYYDYQDVLVSDANWAPIAPLAWMETYGPMRYGVVTTTADLTLSASNLVTTDSYVFTDPVGAPAFDRYMARGRGRTIEIDPPVVSIPSPQPEGECYDICLNRNWTGDCDLDLTGSPGELKLPMAGCVTLATNSAGAYSFDPTEIANRAGGSCSAGTSACGAVSVMLQDVGGGCNVDDSSTIYGNIEDFWANVSLSNGNDTLCWDLTGANAMVFDPSCRQVQDDVTLSISVPLPVINNGGIPAQNPVFLSVSNDPSEGDFPCISVTNSCLAEGTMVELAAGEAPVPIESIAAGTMASNPFAASGGSTVMDVAKGFEDVPMVRIEDAAGHSLLLTRKHPVLVPGRGMIQAEDLAVGDAVMTKSGPSTLTRITSEKFDGSVHNLKVGSDDEAKALGADQTVLYANGILVGDGQVQSKYESLELQASKKVDLDTLLTPGWKRDFRNSAKRAKH